MIELENEKTKLSHFDTNNTYYTFPIKVDIMHLQDMYKENDEESGNKESDNDDTSPYVIVLDDSTEVEIEVQEDNDWDLDLSLRVVANDIADSALPTGAHILESHDIWITDTGATSHISKHAGGRWEHHQTNVRTHEFVWETI